MTAQEHQLLAQIVDLLTKMDDKLYKIKTAIEELPAKVPDSAPTETRLAPPQER